VGKKEIQPDFYFELGAEGGQGVDGKKVSSETIMGHRWPQRCSEKRRKGHGGGTVSRKSGRGSDQERNYTGALNHSKLQGGPKGLMKKRSVEKGGGEGDAAHITIRRVAKGEGNEKSQPEDAYPIPEKKIKKDGEELAREGEGLNHSIAKPSGGWRPKAPQGSDGGGGARKQWGEEKPKSGGVNDLINLGRVNVQKLGRKVD